MRGAADPFPRRAVVKGEKIAEGGRERRAASACGSLGEAIRQLVERVAVVCFNVRERDRGKLLRDQVKG